MPQRRERRWAFEEPAWLQFFREISRDYKSQCAILCPGLYNLSWGQQGASGMASECCFSSSQGPGRRDGAR